MVKVLFIGHYKEKSGWGEITRNWIKELNKAGVDVVPRPIILSDTIEDSEIKVLEEKDSVGCTHVIQCVLPQYMTYSPLKNIGLFMWETLNIPVAWKKYVSMMDEVWVTNSIMFDKCKELRKSIYHIPCAFADDWHDDKYNTGDFDDFVFYTIGEMNKRKNFQSIIKAFHSEFGVNEPVRLLIKTGLSGVDGESVYQMVDKESVQIKQGLRLYPDVKHYKKDIIITDHLSRYDIIKLHNSCDCYVSASHGEACNIPMWEAALSGKQTIGVKNTGEEDVAYYQVNSYISPCYKWNTLDGYATARDYWVEPDVCNLMKCMRLAYNKGKGYNNKDINNINVGKVLKSILYKEF